MSIAPAYRVLIPLILFFNQVQADTSINEPTWPERNYLRVHKSLHASANWLDKFFADDRFEDEQAWTRLKLRWTTSDAEHDDVDHDIRLRGKIVLPNLQNRWRLVFEGDPEEDDITGLEKDSESTTSLRYIVRENLKRRLSIDVGIRGGFSHPSVRTQIQYRVEKQRNDWLHRIRPTIEYDSRDDWQTYIRYDVERQIGDQLYFRSSTTPRWQENEHGFQLNQDFTIFRELCPHRYLAFDWQNSYVSEPHGSLEATRLRVRFRREIWQDKLFMELAPGVRFLAEDDHRAEAEAYFRLELLFQKKPNIKSITPEPEAPYDDEQLFCTDPEEELDCPDPLVNPFLQVQAEP